MTGTPLDPWVPLTRLTTARIALGRAGGSLPTRAHLAFQLAHAQARDAVHHAPDLDRVAADLGETGLPVVRVESAVGDRTAYLQRPDLGRRLAPVSRERLAVLRAGSDVDVAVVVADGLSGVAVERHAAALVRLLVERLRSGGWRLAPIVLVSGGRVAIGDEIGALLGARLTAVFIGERPGLSAPDSLGAYLTFDPRPSRTDADRNCVSNIRPEGLPLAVAADRIAWLLHEARRRRLTGVALKEETGRLPGPVTTDGETGGR
jgi:ethanolamine ammonia-lyase small subunit